MRFRHDVGNTSKNLEKLFISIYGQDLFARGYIGIPPIGPVLFALRENLR